MRRLYLHNALSSINYVTLLYLIISNLIPYFLRNTNRTVQIIVLAIGMVSYFLYFICTQKKLDFYLLSLILIWQAIEVIYRFYGISTSAWGNYLLYFMFYLMMFISFSISEIFSVKQQKILALIVYLIMLWCIINNIILSYIYPGLVFDVYTTWGDAARHLNFGSTTFAIAVVYYCGINIIILINSNKKHFRVISVISIILSYYSLIFIFQRLTETFFLCLLSILLISVRNKNKRKTILNVLLFIFIVLLIGILWDPLLNFIISLTPSERIVLRLYNLKKVFSGSDSLFSISRFQYSRLDLQVFMSSINSFFFGVGSHLSVENIFASRNGQHSEILDMLAKYGMLGIVFLVLIFRRVYKKMNNCLKECQCVPEGTVIFFTFLIHSLFNLTFSPDCAIIVFLLTGLLPAMLNDSSNKIGVD